MQPSCVHSTVDDNELGKVLIFVEKTPVPAMDDLGHRGKIIRTLHRLDVEMAVFLFGRFSVPEDHAGRYRI